MAEWLSEEWVKEMAALAGSRPSLTGATGTVSVSVSSGSSRSARASGEVSYYWRYEDGVAGGGGIGTPPVADVALVMARSDAWSVLTGEMDPSVAYMRGPAQSDRRRAAAARAAQVLDHRRFPDVAPAGAPGGGPRADGFVIRDSFGYELWASGSCPHRYQ